MRNFSQPGSKDALTPEQRQNRQLLRSGFDTYLQRLFANSAGIEQKQTNLVVPENAMPQ